MTTNGIHTDDNNVDDLIQKVDSLVITDGKDKCKSCTTCQKYASSLSNVQKIVFHQVHESIDKEASKVILIDAPSGTGKSYLLSRLALKYGDSLHFTVFRKDQSSDLFVRKINSYTYVSYNMRNFEFSYYEALGMFNVAGLYDIDVLFLLITYAKRYIHVSHTIKVIILDSYTIVSPLMLLLLYIISLKNKLTLVFAGNKLQLGAINKSPLHSRGNFDILEIFSHQSFYELAMNLRITDRHFLDKLSHYRSLLGDYISKGDAPFHFNLRYSLYRLFPDKYNPAIIEDMHSVYMAPIHRSITKRMYRFMKRMKPKDYHVEPFSNLPFDNDDQKKNKFFPGLLLVKGCKYVHITKEGINHIVVLVDLNFGPEGLDTLNVRFADGTKKKIERCILNYYQILPAYRKWLENYSNIKVKDLKQFPLRPYTLTYHAALGRTISDPIELDTNCSKASSVYVGLCCLPSESVIRKFHAEEDFLSFIATDYMESEDNGKYYYHFPSTNPDGLKILEYLNTPKSRDCIKPFLKEIQWITVTDINSFDRSNQFVRIKRSVFEKSKKVENKVTITPLMEVTSFIKDKPNVIVDTIKNIKHNAIISKNKKLKAFRQLESYTSLKAAYHEWKEQNKKDKTN